MNFGVFRLLFRKEILDIVRDRRTLISLILAPVLVGPAISAGMGYFLERSRVRAKQERFTVGVHESTAVAGLTEALARSGLETIRVDAPRDAVESKRVTFGIEAAGPAERPAITFYSDNSEMMVSMARVRVNEALDRLARERVRSELERRGVPPAVLEPFARKSVNVAQPRKMTGSVLGTMVGFLLLMFLFNGAMYAAVDATAGEKERKTLEMLLSSAAGRLEIVLAKVAAALSTSLFSTVLTMASYAAALGTYKGAAGAPALVLPADPASLALLLLLILPVALLAAAGSVAAAAPARSTREAMSYLTPGLFVVLFLSMVTFVPDLESRFFVALVPFANFSKLLRQVLAGEWSWGEYAAAIASNTIYAAAAVALAVRSFRKESILFRT